jgi:hypothetical protein
MHRSSSPTCSEREVPPHGEGGAKRTLNSLAPSIVSFPRLVTPSSRTSLNFSNKQRSCAANIDPKRFTESAGVNSLVNSKAPCQLQDLRNDFLFL